MAMSEGHDSPKCHLERYYRNYKNYRALFKLYCDHNEIDCLIEEISSLLNKKQSSELEEQIITIISNIDVSQLKECSISIRLIHRLLKHNTDIIDLHFKYSLEGKGFEDAKADFIKQIVYQQ
jgi:hypothetical protein